MKNTIKLVLLFASLVIGSQSLSGQTVGQGVWMLGGSGGFRSVSLKADGPGLSSNTTIEFSPNIGYFIADDLAVGLQLTLRSESNPNFLESDESTTDFGLGPFVRFYFADAIFAQASVELGLGDNEFTDFGLGVGYSWFLSDGVAIEPMLFYRIHGVDLPNDAGDFSTFGLSIGIQAFVHHDHGME